MKMSERNLCIPRIYNLRPSCCRVKFPKFIYSHFFKSNGIFYSLRGTDISIERTGRTMLSDFVCPQVSWVWEGGTRLCLPDSLRSHRDLCQAQLLPARLITLH